MNKPKFRYLVAIPLALLLLGWTFMSVAPVSADSGHQQTITISGTGNFATTFVNTVEHLNPSCVLLVTHTGTTTSTGLITTNSPGGYVFHGVGNTCVTPVPPAAGYVIYTFDDVTIAGKTGGIVLQFLTSTTPGPYTESQITVLSGSGDLTGITGHGVASSHSTTTSVFTTYWIELTWGNSAD